MNFSINIPAAAMQPIKAIEWTTDNARMMELMGAKEWVLCASFVAAIEERKTVALFLFAKYQEPEARVEA